MKNLSRLILISIVLFSACSKDNNDVVNGLGWFGDDKTDTIPVSVNATTLGLGNTNVPSSHSIADKFPPVGDQGQFGTCVSWAIGYNYKTFLEGVDNNRGASELAQTNNQLSPKDLYLAIDDNLKSGCDGTNFTVALDVLLQRGIATFQTVPYTNLSNCSQSGIQSSWTTEAAAHKINNYRKIDVNANTIKSYVADNIPVIFGARLGDNFMNWNNNQVITGHSGFDNVGIHAYHAMVVAGYDDAKGPNGAFRVINSWGGNWGDAGSIWIDYNFFVTDFVFGGNCYIAANGQSDNNPPDVNPTINGAVDLAPWAFVDYATGNFNLPTERKIQYNIYNIGDQTASALADWSLYYIYYNAYDATDWDILFENEFNTTIPLNSYSCTQTGDHCVINMDIGSGENFAALFLNNPNATYVDYTYYVPNITGYYYLVLFADGGDVFQENDEQNNFFYTTSQYPVYFSGGVGKTGRQGKSIAEHRFENKKVPTAADIQRSEFRSAVSKRHPNTYSLSEIKQMLVYEKQTGNFESKVQAFRSQSQHRSQGSSSKGLKR